MHKKTNLWSIIFCFFIVLFFLQSPFLKGAEIEPSIVFLIIRTEARDITRDDFFEILDLQDYILLPVAGISRFLDLQTRFYRDENILHIEHVPSGKKARVDFNLGIYEGYPELTTQSPIQFEGDFFVSSALIESLTGATISWNSRRQEVIITVDLVDEDLPVTDEPETPFDPFRPVVLVPDTFGADYSLGSIQYRVSAISRRTHDGNWIFSSQQRFNIHGRVQNWGLSLGLSSSYNFTRSTYSLNLPLIRATYRDEGLRVIFGDSRINYPSTLGRTSLRGANLQFPGTLSSKQFSYTTISGVSKEGSLVQLFVNERLISSQVVGTEEVYIFKNILLVTGRANSLKIVIENADGTIEEVKKKIVGHPDILRENTREISIAAGLHGRVGSYNGNMLGGLFSFAISKDLTLDIEILRLQRLMDGEYQLPEVGSVIRLIGRPLGSTVVGIDWLVGGYAYDLAQGFRFNLLQGFQRGYLEGNYSYVPPKVSRTIREISGQRLSLTGGYDITTKWGLRLQGDFRRSLPEMVFSTMDRGILSIIYRDSGLGTVSLSLIGGKREFDLERDDEFTRVETRDLGFRIEQTKRSNLFDLKLGFGYLVGELFLEDGTSMREDNIESEIDLSRAITPDFNLSGNLEFDARFIDQVLYGGKLRLEAGSNWRLNPNTFLTGSADSDLYFEEIGLSELERGETGLGLNLIHFFSYDTVLSLGASYNRYPYLDISFFSAQGSFSHFWADRKGTLNLETGLKAPISGRESFQFSGGAGIGWTFESGLMAEFEARRLYQTMYDEKPIYSIEVSFSQVLGLASGKLVGQADRGSNFHNNFIAGIVFLDLNGNGVYDKGEPLIENIPMLVGGVRGSTDKNGRFLFENMLTGIYEVKIDETLLPADYILVTKPKIVELRENENFFLEFGVTANGVISGRVFLDRNLSGTFDAGDETISFVGIYVETLDRVIYTRRDGTFYLENIPLGEHRLKVLIETLPAFTKVEEKEILLTLTPEKLAVENVLIPIRYDF